MIRRVTRRPVPALAAMYDGTIDSSDELMAWVKKQGRRQKLEPEGRDGRLVLRSPEGTFDLFERWYLVWDNNEFKTLTPDEFHETYEAK